VSFAQASWLLFSEQTDLIGGVDVRALTWRRLEGRSASVATVGIRSVSRRTADYAEQFKLLLSLGQYTLPLSFSVLLGAAIENEYEIAAF
jgi:hypothetical protein